ncbi:hypothetical protein D3C75_819990 [compost metagenome]
MGITTKNPRITKRESNAKNHRPNRLARSTMTLIPLLASMTLFVVYSLSEWRRHQTEPRATISP